MNPYLRLFLLAVLVFAELTGFSLIFNHYGWRLALAVLLIVGARSGHLTLRR